MQILTRRYERWGIDVDIQFEDATNASHVVTMRFDSDEQVDAEAQGRVDRMIANLAAEAAERQNKVNTEAVRG